MVLGMMGILMWMLGGDIMEAPPRDQASLLSPGSTLAQMQVNADEASLITLLQARHEDKPVPATGDMPGPVGDTEYVKQLLAIRAPEGMRSAQAIRVLEQIAEEDDITLADAAAQAVAVIGGKAISRPAGLETLEPVAGMVPPDTGFVLVADVERGSKTVTLREAFAVLQGEDGQGA